MKLAKAIAGRIKSLRESAQLSQQEVAMRGDLSMSLVAKIEQGKKADPRASTVLALADALGVKPGAILDDLLPATKEKAPAVAEQADAVKPDGTEEPPHDADDKTKKKPKKKKKK